MRIMAGIVAYNPDIAILKANLEAIRPQVECVVLVDNGSENIGAIEHLAEGRAEVLKNGGNRGIAFALNRMMRWGEERGFDWVVTLDQDSVVPGDLVGANLETLKAPDIAVIAPVICDRRVRHRAPEEAAERYSEVPFCITSASLTSVAAWRALGGFDEVMFIDYVDWDYCLRARARGYRILRNNRVRLSHQIGNIEERCFFGRWLWIWNHSAFRRYYQMRNLFYFDRKHFGHLTAKSAERILFGFFKVLMYENEKKPKLRAMLRGLRDGVRMHPERERSALK